MNFLEKENEEAIELIAQVLEPLSEIMTDEEVKKTKDNKIKMIKTILQKHSKEIVVVLATLEGVPVEEYHANVIKMTKQLLSLINNPELNEVFS